MLTCHIHRMLTTPSRDFQLFVFIIWNFSHLSIVLYNLFHRLSRAFRAGNGKTPLRHGVSRATSPQGEAVGKAPLEGSCQRQLTERCCSTIKKEAPLPRQRGFFLYNLYDREFQGIRKYQPYRLQATPGHQNRLLAPAVQAHIADRKDDVRMVYHILVPFPQTVLRIMRL